MMVHVFLSWGRTFHLDTPGIVLSPLLTAAIEQRVQV